jgi:hypothetical protein
MQHSSELTPMGNHHISRGVKLAALRVYECDLLPLRVILECCDFSIRTWYCIHKLWIETGDVINPLIVTVSSFFYS